MATELKPCPFCGGKAFVYCSGSPSNGEFMEIICKECHCQTPRLRDDKAIEAWNRRAEDAVEVVHGEWTEIEDDYCGLIGLECSHCEKTWWFDEESPIGEYHFCPGCGADMRGDGNG